MDSPVYAPPLSVFPPSIEEVTKSEFVNAPAPSSASGHPSPSESKSKRFGIPSLSLSVFTINNETFVPVNGVTVVPPGK